MMRKKRLVWLCLLGFVLALAYAVGNYPQQSRVAPEPEQDSRRTDRTETPPPAPLATAATEAPKYPGVQADLFRPLFSQPPKPRASKKVVKRKVRPAPPPPPPPVKPPTPPVAKRLASFTYLGQAREGERRSIFLKEKKQLFVVKVGEDFGKDKEFHLVELTDREIRIETGEPMETIRIPLQKKQPLRMKTASRLPNRKAQRF